MCDPLSRELFKVLAALAVLSAQLGCQRTDTPTSQAASVSTSQTSDTRADDLLSRMEQVYRYATGYADQGRVRLRYRQHGDIRIDEAPLAVATRFPGQLRVEAYHAVAVCNGQQLRAQIHDQLSGNIDGQILVRDLNGPLSLEQLYHDPLLRESLTSGLGRQPLQLELLFADKPLQTLWQGETIRRVLDPVDFEGHRCQRVSVASDSGTYVFWIDQENQLLRCLEYPADRILPELAASEDVRELSLRAEFREASLAPAFVDGAFEFPIPPGSKQVHAFVLPPPALPSELFGHRPAPFAAYDLTGQRIGPAELDGKVAVLVWFNGHPACRVTLEQLSSVYEARRGDDSLRVYAIATEPSSVTNAQIASMLKSWQVELPLLRDLDACGNDVFRIPTLPTLVVLDAQGTVQIFEAGANTNLARELPVILDRLSDGHDLASEIREAHATQQLEYAKLLSLAQDSKRIAEVEQALARIKPHSEPAHLSLEPLWSIDTLEGPGNGLLVDRDDNSENDAQKLLIIEAGQKIVELSLGGQVLGRHELDLNESRINVLRGARSARGEQFYLVGEIQGQRAYLFDSRWQRQLEIPAADQNHPGLSDLQLAPPDEGHDEPTIVLAFADQLGIQCHSPDGRQLGSNPLPAKLLSLALASNNSGEPVSLWGTNEAGKLLKYDLQTNSEEPVTIADRTIFHLYTANFPTSAATVYCGLTYSEAGNLVALGLDAELREVWNYPLPNGTFRNPIQFVTSGVLAQAAYWCVAAPDGTVHFIRADGQFSDNFATGHELTGLQLASDQLVVMTREAVISWRIKLPPPE